MQLYLFSISAVFVIVLSRFVRSNQIEDRGIVICSGDGDIFLELLASLIQLNAKPWLGAKLPITVAHCDEISTEKIQILQDVFKINVVDICSNHVKKDSFKNFFCKPLALLHSPYVNTLVMDTDVIWLKDFMHLFESSSGYESTGSLFFRDRITQTKNKLTLTSGKHNAEKVHRYVTGVAEHIQQAFFSSVNLDYLDKARLAEKNAFWKHYASRNGVTPDHMQDSSVVMLNNKIHEKTLFGLKLMLKQPIGYGDKELYWLAATAANQSYAFEPYLSGSVGDCGALLHFDPTQNSNADPLYINSEYFIDLEKLTRAGEFLDGLKVTVPKHFNESTDEVKILKDWRKMQHGFYPCGSCEINGCIVANEDIKNEIFTRQQLILELKKISNRLNINSIQKLL